MNNQNFQNLQNKTLTLLSYYDEEKMKKAKRFGATFNWDTKEWRISIQTILSFSTKKLTDFFTEYPKLFSEEERNHLISLALERENKTKEEVKKKREKSKDEGEREFQEAVNAIENEEIREAARKNKTIKKFVKKSIVSLREIEVFLKNKNALTKDTFFTVIFAVLQNYDRRGISYEAAKQENIGRFETSYILEKVMNGYARHNLTGYDVVAGEHKDSERGYLTELGREGLGF